MGQDAITSLLKPKEWLATQSLLFGTSTFSPGFEMMPIANEKPASTRRSLFFA
jgi:hypothetical protein